MKIRPGAFTAQKKYKLIEKIQEFILDCIPVNSNRNRVMDREKIKNNFRPLSKEFYFFRYEKTWDTI